MIYMVKSLNKITDESDITVESVEALFDKHPEYKRLHTLPVRMWKFVYREATFTPRDLSELAETILYDPNRWSRRYKAYLDMLYWQKFEPLTLVLIKVDKYYASAPKYYASRLRAIETQICVKYKNAGFIVDTPPFTFNDIVDLEGDDVKIVKEVPLYDYQEFENHFDKSNLWYRTKLKQVVNKVHTPYVKHGRRIEFPEKS